MSSPCEKFKPYRHDGSCVRCGLVYQVHKPHSLIIAIDFDGTIIGHTFPNIGDVQPLAFEVMKALQKAGHRLVLNTCRTDVGGRDHVGEAVEFCKQNGVVFRSVNENHPEDLFADGWVSRKVYADVYIDDKNLGGFPGWAAVAKALLCKVYCHVDSATNYLRVHGWSETDLWDDQGDRIFVRDDHPLGLPCGYALLVSQTEEGPCVHHSPPECFPK